MRAKSAHYSELLQNPYQEMQSTSSASHAQDQIGKDKHLSRQTKGPRKLLASPHNPSSSNILSLSKAGSWSRHAASISGDPRGSNRVSVSRRELKVGTSTNGLMLLSVYSSVRWLPVFILTRSSGIFSSSEYDPPPISSTLKLGACNDCRYTYFQDSKES